MLDGKSNDQEEGDNSDEQEEGDDSDNQEEGDNSDDKDEEEEDEEEDDSNGKRIQHTNRYVSSVPAPSVNADPQDDMFAEAMKHLELANTNNVTAQIQQTISQSNMTPVSQ